MVEYWSIGVLEWWTFQSVGPVRQRANRCVRLADELAPILAKNRARKLKRATIRLYRPLLVLSICRPFRANRSGLTFPRVETRVETLG